MWIYSHMNPVSRDPTNGLQFIGAERSWRGCPWSEDYILPCILQSFQYKDHLFGLLYTEGVFQLTAHHSYPKHGSQMCSSGREYAPNPWKFVSHIFTQRRFLSLNENKKQSSAEATPSPLLACLCHFYCFGQTFSEFIMQLGKCNSLNLFGF